MDDKKKFKLTELFLIKAGKKDFERTFPAVIYRETDEQGNPLVRCNVKINEGRMWGVGKTAKEVGENLDSICLMKLDFNLHGDPGKSIQIAENKLFLN